MKTGSAVSRAYGSGMSVMFPKILIRGPQDSTVNTIAVTASAMSVARRAGSKRRQRKTTQTTASTSSGTPKNEFSSVSLGASEVSRPAMPASERSGNAPYAAMSSACTRGSNPVPWKSCGPKKCSHRGYARRTNATAAVTPSPRSIGATAARASSRRAGVSAQTARKTAQASATKKSPSAAIENATATSTPRISPPRSACRGVRNAKTRHSSSGTSQPAVQLRCALACETMPGANPMNSPPSTAAAVDVTTCRDRNRYHA